MAELIDAQARRKATRKGTAPLRKALEALDAFCAGPPTLEVLERKLADLGDARFEDEALEAQRQALHAELGQQRQRMRAKARSRTVGGLTRLAEAEGLQVEVLTESPLELRLSPLTVQIDFAANQAKLAYAREVVQRCPLDPPAIWKARQEAIDRIRSEALPSPEFFEVLRVACRTVQQRRGMAADARVDLVDLLGPLSLLVVPVDKWRGLGAKGLPSYPRWLLAYQLQRLRKDACLSQGGLRVELGAAAGGSARKKQNVLFVPAAGDGQYHLSIRLTEQ